MIPFSHWLNFPFSYFNSKANLRPRKTNLYIHILSFSCGSFPKVKNWLYICWPCRESKGSHIWPKFSTTSYIVSSFSYINHGLFNLFDSFLSFFSPIFLVMKSWKSLCEIVKIIDIGLMASFYFKRYIKMDELFKFIRS